MAVDRKGFMRKPMVILKTASTQGSETTEASTQGCETTEASGTGHAGSYGVAIGTVVCWLFVALCIGMKSGSDTNYGAHIFAGLDVFATLAFAIAGAYAAGNYRQVAAHLSLKSAMVVIGSGIVTGVGGGLIRDAVILRALPVVFADTTMLPAAALGGLVGLQTAMSPRATLARAIDTMDSIALGVAIVIGVVKGHLAVPGHNIAAVNCSAIVCAFLTAYGGGILRDLGLGRTPTVLTSVAMLWPALGALTHVGLLEALQLLNVPVEPVELWFVIIPAFAAANLCFSGLRFPDERLLTLGGRSTPMAPAV